MDELWITCEWNNDGLALLGDEVLDVIVLHDGIESSDAKMGRRVNKKALNHQRKLVLRKACAFSAFALGLRGFVQCRSDVPSDDTIAEAFEAVLGAAFRDGGHDAAALIWKRAQPLAQRVMSLSDWQYTS